MIPSAEHDTSHKHNTSRLWLARCGHGQSVRELAVSGGLRLPPSLGPFSECPVLIEADAQQSRNARTQRSGLVD